MVDWIEIIYSAYYFWGHMLKTMMSKVLLCWGIVYAWLAFSWATTPTQSRLAGISWIPFPVDEKFIALFWAVGSVFALLGAFRKKLTVAASAIPAIVPLMIALIFVGAWIDSGDASRITSIVSYAGFGISQFIIAAHPSAYMNFHWADTKPEER